MAIEEMIRGLVRDLCGHDVISLDPQAYGHVSATWAARTDRETYYVRTSPDPDAYGGRSGDARARVDRFALPESTP